MKRRASLLLLVNRKVARNIQAQIADFVVDETIEKTLLLRSQNSRYAVVLYLRELLTQKKYQQLYKSCELLKTLKSKNNTFKSRVQYIATQAGSEVSLILPSLKLSEASSEDLATIMKSTELLVEMCSRPYYLSNLITTILPLYIINGSPQKALALAKKIKQSERRRTYPSRYVKRLDNLKNWLKKKESLSMDEQVKQMQKKILNSEAIKYLFSARKSDFERLRKKYGLTEESVK
ncbi:MAG: hypothetical protein HRT88_22650 [Lentisphaeraceae bacterium]|nr:hypothetical protein [Lentisphaeraceae bacterium]